MILQKKNLFSLVFALLFAFSYAQESRQVSLQECIEQAVIQHPLYQQHQLQGKFSDLQMKNLQSDLYPSLTLNGKASWQNEVVDLPTSLPGFTLPEISKDQYRLSLDISQPIFRGGLTRHQNILEENALDMANMLTDKELYALKAQAKSLFIQIVIANKQKQIIQSYFETLEHKYSEMKVLVKEGVALDTGLDVIKLELINAEQELFNIKSQKVALLKNLNELTQMNIDESSDFILPKVNNLPLANQDRFEYHLMSLQQKQLENSKDILDAKTKPMLFAFATTGVGRPGFNLLSNDFEEFYMVGLNLKWDLWDWSKNKNEKKKLDINQQLIETQKKSFELNIQLALNQLQSEIEKQEVLVDKDPEKIALRENVVKTAEAQLNNGTLTSTEFIVELQKLNQEKLNYEMHQIGLVNSQIAYIELLGKL